MQFGDDSVPLLVPEAGDGVYTVLVLYFVKGCVIHHAHVHVVEEESLFGVVVS